MKKTMMRILSCFLSFALMFPCIAVSAADSKFVSFSVECIDENGDTSIQQEYGYYDGESLYVSIDFLSKYTVYYFDRIESTFIRIGHSIDSRFGAVSIDFENKTATLYMCNIVAFDYELRNVYCFGGIYYLPLGQMAALLKACIETEGTVIRIVNSGYSLSDVQYAMLSNNSDGHPSTYYLQYEYGAIVDDIYGGSERLFFISGSLNYFSSVIFGRRLSKLDVLYHSGDIDEYESFFEKCVTDNEVYIENITSYEDLQNRFYTAHLLCDTIQDSIPVFKEVTSVVKNAIEPVKDSSLEDALLYVNANDWNQLFSVVSDVLSVADYYLKFGSMCEDHVQMINNFAESDEFFNMETTMRTGVSRVKDKFASGFLTSATTEIVDLFLENHGDDVLSLTAEVALDKALPVSKVVGGVSAVFKLCGFDLTADSEYSILLELMASRSVASVYYDLPINVYENKDCTEEARLAIIFYLLAKKQVYVSANKLSDKMDAGVSYDDRIEMIDALLTLCYFAAQSKNFDSVECVDTVKELNEKAIGNIDFSSFESVPTDTVSSALTVVIPDMDLLNFQNDKSSGRYWSQRDQVSGDYTYGIDLVNTSELELNDEAAGSVLLTPLYRLNNITGEKSIISEDCFRFCVTSDYVLYAQRVYNTENSYQGYGGIDYCRCDLDGRNKIVLHHDNYTPFGSSVGEPPNMLVTNDYVYIDKFELIKINIQSGEKESIFDSDDLEVITESYLPFKLDFVVGDTYYFEAFYLANNKGIAGYYRYNETEGFVSVADIQNSETNDEYGSVYGIMSSAQKKVLSTDGITFYLDNYFDMSDEDYVFTPSVTVFYDFSTKTIRN